MTYIDIEKLWDKYFSGLSNNEQKFYDGSCTCKLCQSIRKGFDELVESERQEKLNQVIRNNYILKGK